MNDRRRKQLRSIQDKLTEAIESCSSARDDEQDYLDAMPEGLAGSERGATAEEAIASLDDALSNLEDANDYIKAAIGA